MTGHIVGADRRPDIHVTVDPGTACPTATWSDWSCEVRLVVEDAAVLEPAAALVGRLMGRVERVASRFAVESELCWANANNGRPTVIPTLLVDLVAGALDGARRSNGALDPTVGRHLARIGYDRDILLVTDSADDPPDRPTASPTARAAVRAADRTGATCGWTGSAGC